MAVSTFLPAVKLSATVVTASAQPTTSIPSSAASATCSSSSSSSSSSFLQCRWPIGQSSRLHSNGSLAPWDLTPARQSRVLRRRERLGLCALADGNESGNGNGSPAGDGPSAAERAILNRRREMLQEYVKNVQPDFMEKFVKRAPEQVVEAMRQTVTNMLGTLPPHFFEISVSTVAENLAQLMYSVMMTGYMFRNAQFRLELQQSLSQAALPEPTAKQDSLYERSVNKSKVAGEVLRWHKQEGVEHVPALEYIEMLESDIRELQQQLESQQRVSRGRNELLEYLKSLQPQNLQELTTTAGEDALEAMNTFISRLLGVKEPGQLKRAATETSAAELAKLLYWLMVVGYSIRNIEVRFDMERILGWHALFPDMANQEFLLHNNDTGLPLGLFLKMWYNHGQDVLYAIRVETHNYNLGLNKWIWKLSRPPTIGSLKKIWICARVIGDNLNFRPVLEAI